MCNRHPCFLLVEHHSVEASRHNARMASYRRRRGCRDTSTRNAQSLQELEAVCLCGLEA